ncbi:MAG: trigger factor, partial [Maricaulaceae bacterium]
MHVEETTAEGLSRTFHVKVPKSELAERLEARIEEIRPQVRLKGFRPGKVPSSHIRKMFGRSMMDEILEEVVNSTSTKTLEERDLRPAGAPDIHLDSDAEQVAKGEADLDFHMHVEIMPEFEPADPKSVSIKRPTAEVSDDDVEKALGDLADSQVTYEPKGADAAAELKDSLLVDFVGTVDGKAFEGGSSENVEIVLGAGRLIPGFEDQLVGAKADEDRKVEVTFPENYPNPELRGKEAVFEVAVKEVRKPVAPTIDDEFAAAVGLSDLDALKGALKTNIEREFSAQSRHRAKRRLLDALDEAHSFDLPQRMVDTEFAAIWSQVERDRERGEMDAEDEGKSEDELKEEYKKIAERRVRLGLVLAEIGRTNNV